jgi:hypothetical protein
MTMNRRWMLAVFAVSVCLVLLIDRLTNALDIVHYDWDFNDYIAMAEKGFNARPLVSPFAYRYPTPFIAAEIRSLLGVSLYAGFRTLAYVGAVLQLVGVYLFVRRFSGSTRGSWFALLVVAFSAFNVKFLTYDVYRPDHLAYAFVTLGLYLALSASVYSLFLVSMVGVQFREFVLLPMLAYLLSLATTRRWKELRRYAIPALLSLLVGVILPRALIHVTEEAQTLTTTGTIRTLLGTLHFYRRDVIVCWATLAYLLPTLMLLNLERIRYLRSRLPGDVVRVMLLYSFLVMVLTMYGGPDLTRFITYLFITQALLVGTLFDILPKIEVATTLMATFVFNRIWADIPNADIEAYLDFYNGYGDRLNRHTALRFGELLLWIGLAWLVRRFTGRSVAEKSATGG